MILINQKNKILLKGLLSISLLTTSLYANDQVLLENAWVNIGYSNAKDTMLSGATTAIGKGYSSLFTNPAGLATNYATGLYIRAGALEHKNSTGASSNSNNSLAKTYEVEPGDNQAIGIFYKYLLLEAKADIHNALGLAYGFETNYGLFSLGLNYVVDETTVENYKDFGMGDYQTAGFQWQKSLVGIDDFYAFYFGFSKKGQGVKQIEGENIYRASPVVQRIGFGFETNIFTTTMLFSFDTTSQSWLDESDSLDTTAYGIKWMPFGGFSIALGHSESTYNTDINLKSNTTNSFGLEFGFWKTNIAIAALQKEVLDDADDVFIQENSVHADISFAF